ncbi:YafY family transcriptional regulator [Sulfitobacter pseudonitzschiae]|uniref:YafY family transcriptional regulator n=1 Tax=Pseudosulfitobacter pseudonitzschiae TaxID=1402135 RepID=A0A9Q2RYG5_9RHOB|nr:YafY family protein [Pseudosulfitobacter pseudonitzschiae]MBM2290536.1 YafY family transcriptional regulator [Pseudosulfitobacter pseudonitzschiae]MBM2295454.1 YafY family transcriptional regulator [Pseudosulfitobacter pseudonitzschiae]MBM2300366.1 YafY family transcriptional regulator [Pseudosulfitobacter pseudonitzschiae]MBM2310151.1 YafY family transcriptional regulator [Pseudosulfitobacter pseudonitzschiae]MBM2315063.1 YafY family transcriptional regulator [Pseudosulfitobacter pseudonit
MSRTHRLFQLMQHLRRLPPPVTAQQLADDMDVSLRTVYRDIDALRGLGAVIDGEAGFGFTLIEDATLPPLGFEDDELEALVLGLRDVAAIGDPALSKAAESALVKIQARVPPRQAHRLKHAILDAHRFHRPATPTIDVGKLRAATWEEVCVRFSYSDAQSQLTERTVRPLGIVYFDHNNVLLAWCLLRQDFRTFRLDRMNDLERTDISFRPHRVALLRQHLERIRADQERHIAP